MTDQPTRHAAGQGKLHYDKTILPYTPLSDEDNRAAAAQIVGANVDLMLALERMPGPIWAILNDRHAAEHHTPQAVILDCVPCQFDRVLAIHRAYDPEAGREQYRDPAELFDQLLGRSSPSLKLKGTRTGRITVEDDGTQVTPHVEIAPGEVKVYKIEG
jgi:hypothetical protein